MSPARKLQKATSVQAKPGDKVPEGRSAEPRIDYSVLSSKKATGADLPHPSKHKARPFRISPHERFLVLGTLFSVLIAAGVLGFIYDSERTQELFVKVPSSFFVLGKFLPLWPVFHDSNYSPYELGAVIWIMDTTTAILFVYSLELLYKANIVARALTKIQKNARLVLRAYPSIRKFTIFGIVLFVLFPVSGTGAIGGAFLGALLGMHRLTLMVSISVGGFLGGMSMAYIATNAEDLARQLEKSQGSPVLVVLILVALALGLFGMNRAYRKALAQAERDETADERDDED